MQVIYLGPNRKDYGLLRNTVYEDGLPANVQRAIAEIPEISRLIAPIEEFPGIEAKMKRKGTPEYRAYELLAGLGG